MFISNKKQKKKVYVGLSGGVDSAVSAALLQRQGYDVTGVFIRIALPGYPCSAGIDKLDAMRVAAHLRIPFLAVDFSKEYEQEVFKTTIAQYTIGRTPNPDTLCNREIKFGKFYEFARSHGADFVATGHYARILEGELYAGADSKKDQSYFLWMVPERVLRHVLFPIGHLEKQEVRKLAKKFGLPNAERKDSQGVCFLGDLSIEDMLAQELTLSPGDVLGEHGEVVGKHEGAALYTLGQRHGFTLQAQTPKTLPHFVIGKDMQNNTITVSTSPYPSHVAKTKITLEGSNWIGAVTKGPCEARFRYRQALFPAILDPFQNFCMLEVPLYVPEGQSLVLYLPARAGRGQRCLGGGIVASAELL